ncbi:MAG: DM13 domain-containing protein [Marinoscillum sp.]
MKNLFLLSVMGLLYSCIGTDYIDDPKDAEIVTNVNSVSLMIGGEFQIEAVYHYNMWVPQPEIELVWHIENPEIARVEGEGVVNGVSKGQTAVVITYPGEDTTSVVVNVVGDLTDVASVTLTSPSSSMDVGASMFLDIDVRNIAGNPYTGTSDTTWMSDNETVATVNQNGLVTGISDGVAGLSATVDGITSETLQVLVGKQGRIGTFQSVGSYKAVGTAELSIDESDQLILTFSDDFTTSFALGTYVYLANTTDGSAVKAQGREIAEVRENGGKVFNVSNIHSDIGLNDFDYVVILCKPASITFGYADLN